MFLAGEKKKDRRRSRNEKFEEKIFSFDFSSQRDFIGIRRNSQKSVNFKSEICLVFKIKEIKFLYKCN